MHPFIFVHGAHTYNQEYIMLKQRSVQLHVYLVGISKYKLVGVSCLEITAVAIPAVCQPSTLQASRFK